MSAYEPIRWVPFGHGKYHDVIFIESDLSTKMVVCNAVPQSLK